MGTTSDQVQFVEETLQQPGPQRGLRLSSGQFGAQLAPGKLDMQVFETKDLNSKAECMDSALRMPTGLGKEDSCQHASQGLPVLRQL